MTCCGKPMGDENGKKVCGTCGSWFDGFVALLGGWAW